MRSQLGCAQDSGQEEGFAMSQGAHFHDADDFFAYCIPQKEGLPVRGLGIVWRAVGRGVLADHSLSLRTASAAVVPLSPCGRRASAVVTVSHVVQAAFFASGEFYNLSFVGKKVAIRKIGGDHVAATSRGCPSPAGSDPSCALRSPPHQPPGADRAILGQ